ncbi:glycosyltransferase [Cryobacterium melibiosiphilum]|uniref:Glycosyltransferase n=1 Tax=Cryobacterium melibiosiphilum TaxID=995039 RepID=A0A3A5MLS5_9MICO|nr:glycosyltransferase [Cryobacterium melibiosiphilum]RJT87803.1 glycosyltransferase [Cryobacterium melibiosiphilum]
MTAVGESFEPISVVIPVYSGVAPEHLKRALGSMQEQSLPADEILIVEDGPLGAALDAVVVALSRTDGRIRRIPLAHNRGVAFAMQAGIEAARNRWVARMDADDISLPHRLELQARAAAAGHYAAIGAAMLEFEGDEGNIVGLRVMPLTEERIRRYVLTNSPINNPTLFLDREAALAVGGVRHVPNMEDYDLFARLAAGGYAMLNLAEPVLLFRADPAMFKRRSAKGMFAAELQMQRNLRSYGLIGTPRMYMNLLVRSAFRALPQRVLKLCYAVLFRVRLGETKGLGSKQDGKGTAKNDEL